MRRIVFFNTREDYKKALSLLVIALCFFAFLGEMSSLFQGRSPKLLLSSQKMQEGNAPLRANSPLFNTALFGTYVPNNLSDAEIKQSMLDLQVVGILFSIREKESLVIIRTGRGEDHYYSVGSVLPGGVEIKRITEKGVVVLHQGVLESLSLPKNELTFDPPSKPLVGE
ncbi:MAG: type II secretion system protein N [Tatlockia sp.]|jgi:general secretion pathway protein C